MADNDGARVLLRVDGQVYFLPATETLTSVASTMGPAADDKGVLRIDVITVDGRKAILTLNFAVIGQATIEMSGNYAGFHS